MGVRVGVEVGTRGAEGCGGNHVRRRRIWIRACHGGDELNSQLFIGASAPSLDTGLGTLFLDSPPQVVRTFRRVPTGGAGVALL